MSYASTVRYYFKILLVNTYLFRQTVSKKENVLLEHNVVLVEHLVNKFNHLCYFV